MGDPGPVRRLAVLGFPVGHSRSPAMQSAALAELGLADEWSYEAIEVAPEEFADRVRAMAGEGFAGANVTIPHKLAALTLADEASAAAREIGAANTISFERGQVLAENTDGAGIIAAIGAAGASPAGVPALVMGAGGSARAAVWALLCEGADVAIWNRTPGRAAELAADLGAGDAGPSPDVGRFEILVNATSVGMGASPHLTPATLKDLPVDADSLGARHLVVDLAYGVAETALVRTAQKTGARVIDGLEVLVHQGAASLRIWTGRNPPIETMRRAARAS
jgi:shikimate dehydrogenase